MIEEITIREKTTDPINMQLLADNVAINISTVDHVGLHMIDKSGEVYRYSSSDSPSYLTIVTASEGKIKFTPPNENIFQYQRSPYKLYVLVYQTSTQHYSCPEEGEAKIILEKEY